MVSKMKGLEFFDLISMIFITFMIIVLISSLTMLIGSVEISKAEGKKSVDTSSTFGFLIETCFKDVINPDFLESCVKNIKEKVYVKVNDTFENKVYEAQNTGLPRIFTVYRDNFVYPVKYNNEIHPAKVEIEIRRFGLW